MWRGNKIIQMYEEDKSHKFLMGLNDEEFSHIRSQILAQEPLANLDRIFNLVMQEENHKKLMTHVKASPKPWLHLLLTHPKPTKFLIDLHASTAVNLGMKKPAALS